MDGSLIGYRNRQPVQGNIRTMSTRRDAREWAVQLLFQFDLNPVDDTTELLDIFWEDKDTDTRTREFTLSLVEGVREHRADIDELLGKYAQNWKIERMGVVDRNILRLALYEMHYMPDIPAAVSINEAVDLAKYFSNTESGKFVNGILDRARKELDDSSGQ